MAFNALFFFFFVSPHASVKRRGLGLGETRSTTPEAHQPSEPGRSAARLLSRAAAAAG